MLRCVTGFGGQCILWRGEPTFVIALSNWTDHLTPHRRVSIMHGRPASIQRSQINTELPVDRVELQPSGRPNTFHNAMAQKDLTEIMEDARDNMLVFPSQGTLSS